MQVKAETSLAVHAEIQQLRERYQVNLTLTSILRVSQWKMNLPLLDSWKMHHKSEDRKHA